MPRAADEFAEHYLKSGIWEVNQEDMGAYLRDFVDKPQNALAYRESAWAEHPKTANKKSSYHLDPDTNEGGHADPRGAWRLRLSTP